MRLIVLNLLLTGVLSYNALSASNIDESINSSSTTLQVRSITRPLQVLPLETLEIRELDKSNIDKFVTQYSELSSVEKNKINSLHLEGIKDKESAEAFFSTIEKIAPNILNVSFGVGGMDWRMSGKYFTKLPHVLRVTFGTNTNEENLRQWINSYQYHLDKEDQVSKVRTFSLSHLQSLKPEAMAYFANCLIVNYRFFPKLLGINLYDTASFSEGQNKAYFLVNQMTDLTHSQRLTCHFGGANSSIAGESTLKRGHVLFTPATGESRRFETSIDMDHAYSAWFEGIPEDFNLSTI